MSGNMSQQIGFAISHSSLSDMCIDFNISTPSFTSHHSNISTPPSTFCSSESSQNSDMKPGLLNMTLSHESSHFRDAFIPYLKANNLANPVTFSVHCLLQLPREDPFGQRIVQVVWPCVLATQRLKLALSGVGFGDALSSIPVAICTKHANVGFLKLEEIEHTEGYTLIIHHHPDPRVVHMYNQCVLFFPPAAQSFSHEKNEQLSNTAFVQSKFLKNCQTCDKSLEGKDIYIYRGDSSFCSEECREVEIEADKQKELMKVNAAASSHKKSNAAGKKNIFYISVE